MKMRWKWSRDKRKAGDEPVEFIWAPWVSSAANPDHATYSYTLPHGGEYSLHVGCGGTTSSWKVAEYSNFHGGTVNDFSCYDESSSSLYTYCADTSS